MLKKYKMTLLFLFTVMVSSLSFAQPLSFLENNSFGLNKKEPLLVDEAFISDLKKENSDLRLIFDIENNYYLYKDKFSLEINNKKIDLNLPLGVLVVDEFYGESEVYHYGFGLKIPVPNEKELNVSLKYQGCSDEFKLCYPPVTKTFNFENDNYIEKKDVLTSSEESRVPENRNGDDISEQDLEQNIDVIDLVKTNNTEDIIDYLKNNKNSFSIYLTFFIIGFFVAFTPCVYPMMPIIVATTVNTKNKFISSLFYVLGIVLSYALIGLITGYLNINLQILMQQSLVTYILFGVLFFLSLYTFGLINIILPNKSNNVINNLIGKINPDKYYNQTLIGFLSSLILSPCSIAPLLGVLIFINQVGDPIFGTILLSVMALGMGVPLLIFSTSLNKFLPKNGSWMNEMKNILGMFLLLMSFYILSKEIEEIYFWILVSFSILFYGLNLLGLNKKQNIGILLIILSLFIFNSKVEIIEKIDRMEQVEKITNLNYEKVSNLEELNKKTKESLNPVFVDFYADWCVSCVRLENKVLNNNDVIEYLNKNYTMLKIDLSEISKSEKEIMDSMNIIGIPYYLFLTKEKEKSIYTGELNKNEFFSLLKKHNEAIKNE